MKKNHLSQFILLIIIMKEYLKQAIESVLSQTYKNFELIIIDDGSKDNSKIISDYKNNSKVMAVYQKNKGLNKSNNLAIKLSRGKFLIRLDADDWLDIRALEILGTNKKDNEIGLIFPDYYEVDNKEQYSTSLGDTILIK